VVEDQACDVVLAEAAAHPLERARHAAARAVGKACAALVVAVHPRIEDRALRDLAQNVQPDAANMLDVDMADVPVVDQAVVAVGHDLDDGTLLPITADRAVRYREG